ncbi:MAG: hypothetical protein IT249_08360 [Chitinophagaceae bacterium]|nr:hypothetical protein [Chitinophagaceae bacterium]
MNFNIDNILEHLFQKQTLEDVDVRDIEQLTGKHPYYAPAQYLLAKKYQQLRDEKYGDQLKKTALYFTNPHWLNALFLPEELADDEVVYNAEKIDVINETIVDAMPPVVEENPASETFKETIVDIVEEPSMAEEKPVTAVTEQIPGTSIAEQIETTETAEHKETPVELPVAEIKTGEEVLEQMNSDAEAYMEETGKDADDKSIEEALLQENIKLPTGDFSLAEAKAAFDKPLPDNDNGINAIIPIDPLHTVDYFASQGIKLSNEYPGKDKLSQKLKSFTEWLKTMKKIHPDKLEAELDVNTQSSIQHMAEHSNEQKEVITEAIAEVYARQGLHKKAIETYQKLSLLNPDKRVYFAAKISKLNEN